MSKMITRVHVFVKRKLWELLSRFEHDLIAGVSPATQANRIDAVEAMHGRYELSSDVVMVRWWDKLFILFRQPIS
jgi:hypothetical protein